MPVSATILGENTSYVPLCRRLRKPSGRPVASNVELGSLERKDELADPETKLPRITQLCSILATFVIVDEMKEIYSTCNSMASLWNTK